MANECLITKLKGTVDNNNLPVLGMLTLKAKTLSSVQNARDISMGFGTNNSIKITVDGNGYFSTSEAGLVDDRKTELTIDSTQGIVRLFFANDTYNIKISNKYSLTAIYNDYDTFGPVAQHLISFDLSDIEYCTALQRLHINRLKGVTGNLSNLGKMKQLNVIHLGSTQVVGDISAFEGNTGIFDFNMPSNVNVTGNINVLSGNNIRYIMLGNTNIGGSLSVGLSGCTDLRRLIIDNTNIAGNIDILSSIAPNLESISVLRCTNITGSVLNIPANVPSLLIAYTGITGTTTQISQRFTNITGMFADESSISGEFDVLGSLIHISDIGLKDCVGIYGTIEGFIANQITAGRTTAQPSDKVMSYDILSKVTIGGQNYTNYARVLMTWESINKWVVYAGGGNDYTNLATYSHVFAKGATAEEISAWEAAGKDVVVIS